MAKVTVSPAILRGKAATLRRLAEEYGQIYSGMYRDVSHTGSFWRGRDSDAYVSRIEGFQPELREMVSILNQYADFLNESAAEYSKLQDKLVNTATHLRR